MKNPYISDGFHLEFRAKKTIQFATGSIGCGATLFTPAHLREIAYIYVQSRAFACSRVRLRAITCSYVQSRTREFDRVHLKLCIFLIDTKRRLARSKERSRG